MKSKKIKDVYVYSRSCNECNDVIKAVSDDKMRDKVVKHYQEEHPLKPERCYDLVGKSWLPGYDSAAQAFLKTKANLDEVENTLQQTEDSWKTLVTKLNSIIMILREGPR